MARLDLVRTLPALACSLALLAPAPFAQDRDLDALLQSMVERPDDPPAAARVHERSPGARIALGSFTSIQVNVDDAGNNIVGDAANEPSLAVDPTDPARIAIGWRQFDDISSNFRQAGWGYSHDAGNTWRFPGVIEPGVFRSDPVLDYTSDGTLLYDSLVDDFTTDLFVTKVSAVSWLPGIPNLGGDKQWMAVDRNGGATDGFMYFGWSPFASCCPGTFTRSFDGGRTYMTPITLGVVFGTMDVGPDGTVYAAGAQPSPFVTSTHLVARSTDAQDPMVTPTIQLSTVPMDGATQLSSGPNPGGLLGQVCIATDHSGGATHGNVYVLASVDPPGPDPLDVHFSRSEDGGVTWSPAVRVNDDATTGWQWFGTLSVAPNGRIDAVWNDTRNDPAAAFSELHYASSVDGGVTWSTNQALSPAFDHSLGYPQQSKLGDYYDMVSDDLGAHLAWAATFNGEQDVYYLRIGPSDCNGNGVDDATDIGTGSSLDGDLDGIPDECQRLIMSPPTPGVAGQLNAIHITRGTGSAGVYGLVGTVSGIAPIGCLFPLGMLDPKIVGPFGMDGSGHLTLAGVLDPALSGITLLFQAVEILTCDVSETVSFTFP